MRTLIYLISIFALLSASNMYGQNVKPFRNSDISKKLVQGDTIAVKADTAYIFITSELNKILHEYQSDYDKLYEEYLKQKDNNIELEKTFKVVQDELDIVSGLLNNESGQIESLDSLNSSLKKLTEHLKGLNRDLKKTNEKLSKTVKALIAKNKELEQAYKKLRRKRIELILYSGSTGAVIGFVCALIFL